LTSFVGTYAMDGWHARVALGADGALTIALAEEPPCRLLPYGETKFALEGFDRQRVEFRLDQAGGACEAIIHRPEGIVVATRNANVQSG
jgi:hypothetical protein